MGDNIGDHSFTNLELNQEPFVDPSPPSPPAPSPTGFGSFLTGREISQRAIEDRIRMIQAVSAGAGQPQQRRRITNSPALTFMSVIEPIVGVTSENQGNNGVNGERSRTHKRDITHLTKALEIDQDANKIDDGNPLDDDSIHGDLFDCNICLNMAKDPILTCCGHLFCWGCFYLVPYVDSLSKECPVCKGEVTDSNITPVYGNGNVKNSQASESNSIWRIPPRPQAHRVESVRQQVFSRGFAHNPVANAFERSRNGTSIDRVLSVNTLGPTSEINLSNSEAAVAARFTPVADTSVNIQPVAQRYVGGTVLHSGALAVDDSIEINLAVSSSMRSRMRRSVVRALSSETESSLEVRRRRLR